MPDTYYLNPKYENFNAYSDVVKFETVHGYNVILNLILGGFIFSLLVFCLFLSNEYNNQQRRIHFEESAVETTATVLDCYQTSSKRTASRYLTYQYQATNAYGYLGAYRVRREVPNWTFACSDAPVGTTIRIQYLPDDVTITRFMDENLMALSVEDFFENTISFLCILAGGLGVIGFGRELLRYVHSQFKWRKLVSNGVLIDGDIIEAEKSVWSNLHTLKITYRFITPTFEVVTAKFKKSHSEYWIPAIPAVGAPVKILYVNPRCYVLL